MIYICLIAGLMALFTLVAGTMTIRKVLRRRQKNLDAQKAERLKAERLRLVAESGGLLAVVEQELPESLRSPDAAPRSPVDPLGIILTAEARKALAKRREIADRISAIDREMISLKNAYSEGGRDGHP